jgi:hypothetical protein
MARYNFSPFQNLMALLKPFQMFALTSAMACPSPTTVELLAIIIRSGK